jgi:hypothetical protein
MQTQRCPRSDEAAAASRNQEWDESLRLHAAACPDCQATLLVAGALRGLAEAPAAAPLPDPAIVFRKARILARFQQEEELTRRAMRPVHVAQWTAFAAAVLGMAWAAGSAVNLGRLAGLSVAVALAVVVALRLIWAEE